jgi:D-aspartate ligase
MRLTPYPPGMALSSERTERTIGGVVIGGDFQGLGIVRSLGRRGVPVCIIDDERSIARYSKYATHSVQVRDLRDERSAVESILEVGKELNLQGWVLYATRDETVAALSRHKERLGEGFRVPTPDWETVRWAWDKRNTYKLCNDLAIPCPKTWYIRSLEDLEQRNFTFPVVIKPAIKEHFFYATKAKAWRADSLDDLRVKFQRASELMPVGEIMIQDLIPGGSEQQFGYCAFFKQGRAIGTMVTQYRRQHPPQFGRSCTFVETVNLPELEEVSERFLRAIDYYGLVEIEFKLDLRDREYKLLDVNARTWGYHCLGAAAGVDFPYMLYLDQIGEAVDDARSRSAITWIRLVTDLPVGLLGLWRRKWGLKSYWDSVTRFGTEAVFSSDDPMPSFVEAAMIPYLYFKKGY